MKIWIRRGYGPFLQMPSEIKARRKAEQWHKNGGGGNDHPVIGLFIGTSKYTHEAQREELYNIKGVCVLQRMCMDKDKKRSKPDVLSTTEKRDSREDSAALEGDESPGAASGGNPI